MQTVKFSVPPERLFDIYMDSKEHGKAIGSTAKMSDKVGAPYSAWDGYITGKNLQIEPKRLIVQTWRASDWKKSDIDSILILHFEKAKGGSTLTMVHANVPDDQVEALDQGWVDNYWEPWKEYLKSSR